MFNFKEAFTYLFKEKDWHFKFLLPFLLQLLIVIPSLTLGLMQPQTPGVYSFNTLGHMSYRYSSTSGFFGLFVSCIFLISFIPYIIVNFWYLYENIQAGIFNRQTKAIWKNDFNDTIKKVGKYALNNIVYSFVITFAIIIIFGFFCVIGLALLVLMTAILQNGNTNISNDITAFLTSGFGLLFFCIIGVIFVIFYFISYTWMMTGSLRLIATNTFSEGVMLQENWHIAWKHKWKFVKLLLVVFCAILIFLAPYITLELLVRFLSFGSTFLNFIFEMLLQILVSAITVYAAYFVYPRLLGQLFRKIVQEEHSLKFIKL